MKRKIIKIDEEKCIGCGACADACHEGAIQMIDGKAKLTREDYCDGLGDCLPSCPVDAITFEEREAPAYDEEAVKQAKMQKEMQSHGMHIHQGGCPGSRIRTINHRNDDESPATGNQNVSGLAGNSVLNASGGQGAAGSAPANAEVYFKPKNRLSNWPVQIKLAPVNAPYFEGANLLIAADCTAYAYANFHEEFIKNRVTLIGCPKLDDIDYSEKLTEIIKRNDIKSVTILRMEVPCCGGLENAAKKALQDSGKFLPWNVVTISIDGHIL